MTHNRLKLLGRCIQSVLDQSEPVDEVILVDDFSTDGTLEFLRDLSRSYPKIKVIRNQRHLGAAKSRNIALRIVSHEMVTGIDDDDHWHPNRIAILKKNFSDKYSFISAKSQVITSRGSFTIGNRPVVTLRMQRRRNCIGGQFFAKTENMRSIGGYDESLQACQDYDLYLRMIAKYGAVKQIQKVLQLVDTTHEGPRISNSPKIGYIQCYFKHRDQLSVRERICQIHRIKEISNGCIPFKWIFMAPSTYMFLKMLKYYIEFRFLNGK